MSSVVKLPSRAGGAPAVLTALVSIAFCCGCDRLRGNSTPVAAVAPPPANVALVAARDAVVERTIVASGDLRSDEETTLSVKVAGRLASLEIDLGDRVKKDAVVARIDAVDAQLQVEQSRALLQQARARLGLPPDDAGASDDAVDPDQTADVRVAKATLDETVLQERRARELVEKQVFTPAEYEAADAAKKVAENRYRAAREEVGNRLAQIRQRRTELAIAEQRLKDTEIRAPFDGVVVERRAGRGDYLENGAPVAALARIDPLRLVLMVPERLAPSARIGQRVRFTLAGTTTPIETRITRLSPVFDPRNRALRVEADVANPDGALRAGAFTEASLIVDEAAHAVMVPAEAIRSFAGFDKVLMVHDGKVVERRITLGPRSGDEIEVSSGLAVGDRVILPPGSLVPGQSAIVAGG